jgi:ABC-2 type transport system ATP-binding protein
VRASGLVLGPLRGVDLVLEPGLTVLAGDHGSGATTLLLVLAGRLVPEAGTVTGGPGALLTMPPGDEWSRADVVTAALGAPHLVGREMGAMSQGERQRVRLASLFARPEPVLLLDEPFGFLDAAGATQVLQALRADGRRVLAVCKSDPRVSAQADRVVALEHGCIVVL